jgi:hypothetical protein
VLAIPNGEAGCGHVLLTCVASRFAVQLCGAVGGFQLRVPTGGAAYGIPKNCRPLELTVPETGPFSVLTTCPVLSALAVPASTKRAAKPAFILAILVMIRILSVHLIRQKPAT